MIASIFPSSVPGTSVKIPVFQDAHNIADKGSNAYDPDKDNFGKGAEWMKFKFGKDTIQPYEQPFFKNGYMTLVPGADHARYILKDFTITVAHVEGECIEIRCQRTTSPCLLDNYEIQQILADGIQGIYGCSSALGPFSGRTVFAKHIPATRIVCFQRSSFKAPRLEESVKIFASALGGLEGVIANA